MIYNIIVMDLINMVLVVVRSKLFRIECMEYWFLTLYLCGVILVLAILCCIFCNWSWKYVIKFYANIVVYPLNILWELSYVVPCFPYWSFTWWRCIGTELCVCGLLSCILVYAVMHFCLDVKIVVSFSPSIPLTPTWSIGHPWNASFHFSFLL
jgi:hypothetical protein